MRRNGLVAVFDDLEAAGRHRALDGIAHVMDVTVVCGVGAPKSSISTKEQSRDAGALHACGTLVDGPGEDGTVRCGTSCGSLHVVSFRTDRVLRPDAGRIEPFVKFSRNERWPLHPLLRTSCGHGSGTERSLWTAAGWS